MKKNLINLAVAAGVAGMAASAQSAMYINPDKTGSVLLFPYYNAENGNQTSMHIVNTTAVSKAVKVRFMEYVNSQEVLDFNLYLSPRDHFAFTIFQNPNGDGGAIVTADNSCTVPALGDATAGVPGSTTTNADGSVTRIQPFLNYQYAKDADSTYSRSLKGHVEVIEMGEVSNSGTNKFADYIKHGANGVPADCAKLVAAWSTNGVWKDTSAATGMGDATGGLYGLSNILNATDAAAYGVEPAAIEGFWAFAKVGGVVQNTAHTNPGDTLPSLASGTTVSIVPNNGASYTNTWGSGVDAVSSLFMTKSISNDVMTNATLAAETDWVITFPTRRYYVQAKTAVAPFTDVYDKTDADSACEPVSISQWDREEAFKDLTETPIFSPKPPTVTEDPNTLCFETNTIKTATESALNANATVELDFQYEDGWQQIGFNATGHKLTANGGKVLEGLPAQGFAAYKYVNGDKSYGFVSDHKTNTSGSAASQ